MQQAITCLDQAAMQIVMVINEKNEPSEFWFSLFRKVGVTRVQLGVTHTNNYLLKRSNRGHTYECSVIATHLLKKNGFNNSSKKLLKQIKLKNKLKVFLNDDNIYFERLK